MIRNWVWCASVALCVATLPALAGGGHTDFEIGQDGATAPTLVVAGDADILSGIEPIELDLQVGGPLDGLYAGNEPGWISVEMDEPGEGLFTLLPGHQVALHRISATPGFLMYDLSFTPILDADGAVYAFSQDAAGGFHEDLFFTVPAEGSYSATFALVDPSGVHGPSQPFTLNFLAVPEPGALALFGLLAAARFGRRRLKAPSS